MKYPNGEHYVEVKDHRYKIHPTEGIKFQKRDPPTSLRTQYQVQNEIQSRRNQKFVKNDNDELVVKNYLKKRPNIQKQLPNCPSCKRNKWLEFDKGYYCKNYGYIINKEKHQIDKKVLRQERDFSTRINYANKKIREIWMNMVTTKYNSTEDMINKLKELKGKTELKFYKNESNYYDNMNIRFDEDPFAKKSQAIIKFYHEVLLVMKFLQTKPQVKNMNINYYDLYYTVIKNRNEKEILDDQSENDYINCNDNFPNHYIGRKNDNVMLRQRKVRSHITHFKYFLLYK